MLSFIPLQVTFFTSLYFCQYIYIYIYIYVCVCVCVCVILAIAVTHIQLRYSLITSYIQITSKLAELKGCIHSNKVVYLGIKAIDGGLC